MHMVYIRNQGHIHGPSNPWYQPHTSMTGGLYFGYGDGTPLSALFPFGFVRTLTLTLTITLTIILTLT